MGIEFSLTNNSIYAILQALKQTTERIMTHPERNKYHRDAMQAVEYDDGDYYVYIHFRNDTGEPFYVGKGKMNGNYDRVKCKNRGNNNHWHNVVSKAGYTVKVIRNCGSNEKLSHSYETELIAMFRGIGFGMTNLTDGGEGASGCVPSIETKRKISEALSGDKHWNYGQTRPETTRELISINHADVSGEKNPMYGRGELLTGENNGWYGKGDLLTGDNNHNFKGMSIGINNQNVIIFKGNKDMKSRGFHQSAIISCINGNRNTHKGYSWIRTDSPTDVIHLLEGREFADEESRIHWEYFQANYW